jgi:hypothetical protein
MPGNITGINVGGSGTFQANPVPDTSVFPAGTVNTWTASDPSITLAPANPLDPSEADVTASVPAGSTLTSFTLSVSTQMPADSTGTVPPPLTDTATIPVIAAPPPPPTGVSISQVS